MTSLQQIFAWFKNGLYPNEDQFQKSWSSFWHKTERMPLTQILGLNNSLNHLEQSKAGRDELASATGGLIPMGEALDMTDLRTKPKRRNDSYIVLDQLNDEGDAYIFRWDEDLQDWINTKQVNYKDVARKSELEAKADEADINSTSRQPNVAYNKVYSFGGDHKGRLESNDNFDCVIGLKILSNKVSVIGASTHTYMFYDGLPSKETYLSLNNNGDIPEGAKYMALNFAKVSNMQGYGNLMVTFDRSAAFVEEIEGFDEVKEIQQRMFSPYYIEPLYINDGNQNILGYGTEIKGTGKTATKFYLKKGQKSLLQTQDISFEFIEISDGVEKKIETLSFPFDKFNKLKDGATFEIVFNVGKELKIGNTYIIRYRNTTYMSLMKELVKYNDNVERGMYVNPDGTIWNNTNDSRGNYGIWVDIDLQSKSELPLNLMPSEIRSLANSSTYLNHIKWSTPTFNIGAIRTAILKGDKDIYLGFWGDSISAFQSTYLSALEGVTNVPPVCDRQAFGYHIFKALTFGSPLYARFDKGKKSLVGNWDSSLVDDSTAFYTEVGKFDTAYCRDEMFNPNWKSRPQHTTEITGGFTQMFDTSESSHQQRNIPKRFSNAANASVIFTIPAGYSKFDFIYHAHNLGDEVTITINRGVGGVKVNTKQNDWNNALEANGSKFKLIKLSTGSDTDSHGLPNKRLHFQITNTSQPTIVTITKSSDTSKYLIYWGVSYWGTSTQPYALHLNCLGRGGYSLQTLASIRNTDIKESNLDMLLMEIPCINNLGSTPSDMNTRRNNLVSGIELLDAYFKELNSPTAYYIPHLTKGVAGNHYEVGREFYNLANGTLRSLNAEVVGDAHIVMRNVWESYYSDIPYHEFVSSIMYDGTHPNENGFLIYKAISDKILGRVSII